MADTLDSIAYVYGRLADCPRAIDHYEQALAMYQHIGDPEGEARSLLHLGDVQLAEGLSRAARRSWERSLGAAGRRSPARTSARQRSGWPSGWPTARSLPKPPACLGPRPA